MNTAEESFRAGDLSSAQLQLQEQIRREPANAKLRVFLAQLMMVQSRWDRALTQLDVLEGMDAGALPMVRTYQSAIQCERLRELVFSGERAPLICGDPEPWLASLLQALKLLAQGHVSQASTLREQAFEDAPASAGTLNGVSFSWIADADSRLGPVLETFINGSYYWLPFNHVSRIVIEPPTDARDLVWLPAQVTLANNAEVAALIPARYPQAAGDEPAFALGRRTEWQSLDESTFIGTGQRVLSTDAVELGLFDVRELTITAAAA